MIQGLVQIGQRVAVIARKLAIPAENIYDCQRGSLDDQKLLQPPEMEKIHPFQNVLFYQAIRGMLQLDHQLSFE